MIPRLKSGRSFKGAGLYYLHDKRLAGEQERLTRQRVAWTYTLNTLESDPEAVLAEMRHTARHQQLLKQMSGNRLDGRPIDQAVTTIALAWSPAQSPDKAQMIETGQSFLRHMGWHEHQALFVAHNDTAHPHVHIILNRVHPETGMTLDDNWSKKRSQQWALKYERTHGHIYCKAREEKYDRGQKDRGGKRSYKDWRQDRQLSNDNEEAPPQDSDWALLKAAQRDERQTFWKETSDTRRQIRQAQREEVRKEFAGDWQAYRLVRDERQQAAHRFDQETRRALRHYRRLGGREAIRQLKERKDIRHKRQREELAALRAEITARQKERTDAAIEQALKKQRAEHDGQYKELLQRQRSERSTLREDRANRPAPTSAAGPAGDRTSEEEEKEARRQERIQRIIAERKSAMDRDRGDGGRER